MSRPLILHHANCADGFCAAWVAWRYFGEEAEYVPVNYGQPPLAAAGRDLYILDFSYKNAVMRQLIEAAAEIVVLDHHKTAEKEFEGLEDFARHLSTPHRFVFDMNKSGGRLAWEHFFPDESPPWLVCYTEDRDLWRWDLPNSREISAALASLPRDFTAWDLLHEANRTDLLAGEGAAILRYQQQLVDSICANAIDTEVGGHVVPAVNTSVLFSEVAGKLAEGKPFGAAWFVRKDGKRQWSLRSAPDGIDVSEVAKKQGGGGHRHAAGFEEPACETCDLMGVW